MLIYFYGRNKVPKCNIKEKNWNTNWHLLQNNKNSDTTLLHSLDDLTQSQVGKDSHLLEEASVLSCKPHLFWLPITAMLSSENLVCQY